MHKGWVRIVNFLKIPPANVQSREAAFECAREGEEGVGWGEDWNLWQLFATGFLRYQRAIHWVSMVTYYRYRDVLVGTLSMISVERCLPLFIRPFDEFSWTRFPSVNTIQMEIRHRFRSSIPAVFRIPSSFGISQNNFRSSRFFFQGKEEFKLFHQGTSKKKIWRLTKKFNIPNHLYRKREKFIASRSALPFTEKNGNRGWLSRGERKR